MKKNPPKPGFTMPLKRYVTVGTTVWAVMVMCTTESLADKINVLSSQGPCRKIDVCSCQFDSGLTIDLHFAAHSDNGKPVFQYQPPKSSDSYKYSPCAGLPCGKDASGSSVCMDASFQQGATNLGTASTAQFVLSGENVTLMYTANQTQPTVTSRVELRCGSQESFQLTGATTGTGNKTFNFTLTSACACPGVCSPHAAQAGMSPGTVLVLLFFSTVLLYFGIGCVYRKAVYGGGCTEIVPHQEFWFSLPSLIRDGYLFFISPCLGNRTEYRAYDKL